MNINNSRLNLADCVPLDKPLVVYLSPCNVCNFNCEYCAYSKLKYYKSFKSMILDISTAKKIINNIKQSFGDIKNITLTSAETLLNSNIAEIVRLSKTVAHHVRIITNGSLLNKELSDSLINSGLDAITISINGLSTNEYYARTKTNVDFREFVQNIRYLSERAAVRGGVSINIKIIDYMIQDEENKILFYETFESLGNIVIEHLVETDSSIDYRQIAGKNYKFETNVVGRKFSTNMITCPIAFYAVNIRENGDVVPCCGAFIKAPVLGNVLESSLSDIWAESLSLQYIMLNGYKNIPECSNCLAVKSSCITDKDYLDDAIDSIKPRYEKLGYDSVDENRSLKTT